MSNVKNPWSDISLTVLRDILDADDWVVVEYPDGLYLQSIIDPPLPLNDQIIDHSQWSLYQLLLVIYESGWSVRPSAQSWVIAPLGSYLPQYTPRSRSEAIALVAQSGLSAHLPQIDPAIPQSRAEAIASILVAKRLASEADGVDCTGFSNIPAIALGCVNNAFQSDISDADWLIVAAAGFDDDLGVALHRQKIGWAG
jgi:hypothetical protein